MDDEGDNLSQGTAKPVPASLDKSASESDGMVEESHSSVLEPSVFDIELSPPGSVDIADTRNFFGTSEASRELNDFLDCPDADYAESIELDTGDDMDSNRNMTSVVFTSLDVDRAVEEARWRASGMSQLSLPWERGIFKSVFSNSPMFDITFPKRIEPLAGIVQNAVDSGATASGEGKRMDPIGHAIDNPIYEHVLKFGKTVSAGVDREKVLRKWACIFSQEFSASHVGRSIELVDSDKEVLQLVGEVFGGKSDSTLAKRARFVARMVNWSLKNKGSPVIFPMTASFILDFMRDLKKEGKNSAVRETLETVAFLYHVAGLDVEFDITCNPLITGISRQAAMDRNEAKQSRVLTVVEVMSLESFLISQRGNRFDLYAIGVFLFMLYSRARSSDIRNISSLCIDITGDYGYIEAKTVDHKSKRLASSLGLTLLLVAPINGLCSGSWGKAFIKSASNVGFDFSQGYVGPLLPCVGADGNLTNRPVDSEEVTRWLNASLERVLERAPSPGLSSHGLKATTLSWMAKSGYSETTRLILGHHSMKGKRTLESYSRDVMAHPLRELEECINSITRGIFLPDKTRSGYVNLEAPQLGFAEAGSFEMGSNLRDTPAEDHSFELPSPVHDVVHETCPEPDVQFNETSQKEGTDHDIESESSDSSSSSSSSSQTEDDVALEESTLTVPAQGNVDEWRTGCRIFQNKKTKTLHLQALGSTGNTFSCGRAIGPEFVEFRGGKIYVESWKCKQCNSSRPLRDSSAAADFLERLSKRRKHPEGKQ